MGMTRLLTTAYHPQADGQIEVLNQSLEISLRSYIGPSRDDWAQYLDALALSYNSTPHIATRFAPEFDEGDLVLLNPHSLSLLRNETGCGKKLLMKYDGPFEVIQKLSAVSY